MTAVAWPALDVERILERLTARGVDYVVIGGIALVLHGSASTTHDLDICFATDEGNLAALGSALIDLNARLRGVPEDVPFVPDGTTLRVEVLTLSTDAGDLDVLANPSGAPRYAVLRERAERLHVGEFAVLTASVEDLIAMKTAAGRPKDLVAVEELRSIARLRGRA